MIADDEVDSMLARMGDFDVGLYATVENDDEFNTLTCEIVDGFRRNAISLLVAGGDEIVDVGVEILEILVDKRDGSGAVDVVVAVYHYLLLGPHGSVEPFDSLVHVGQKERVVEVLQLRMEEAVSFFH